MIASFAGVTSYHRPVAPSRTDLMPVARRTAFAVHHMALDLNLLFLFSRFDGHYYRLQIPFSIHNTVRGGSKNPIRVKKDNRIK